MILMGLSFSPMAKADGPIAALTVTQKQYQVPVLTQKRDNPVLLVNVALSKENKASIMDGLVLQCGKTTDLRDIKTIRVYYFGKDTVAGKMQEVTAPLFGEIQRIEEMARIAGNQQLQPGDNYFWVSVELHEAADLTNSVTVACTEAVVGGNSIAVSGRQDAIAQRIGVAVRQHMQDEVHTSRIPGMATTSTGTLLAIFDVRYESARDLQGHMDIGLHRSTDGGHTWEPLRIAMDMGEWGGLPQKFNGVSDACILVDKNSDAIYIAGLWMYGVINDEGEWVEGLDENSEEWNHQWRNKGSQSGFDVKQTSQFLIVKSTDDGKTWSKPENITRMCKREEWWLWAPAPGQGITMENGTLVFPTQGRDSVGRPFSNITYSRDGGTTWHTSNPALDVEGGTTECAVAQLSDGGLMLNMRANRNRGNTGLDNGRAVAVTYDLGNNWEEHHTSFSALPEPTCMASLHVHKLVQGSGHQEVLVFSNPNSKTARNHITVKVSTDDGATWPSEHWMLLDEWNGRGYSCITSVDEHHIGILYESSQADLVFQKIAIEELLKQ